MPVRARSGFSAQTLSVLAALCAWPSRWCRGYALAGAAEPTARPGARAARTGPGVVARVVHQ